ncbi:MAG: homoserine O-acetyltransferase [Acidobacteriota bacterium]|nr:homoserine O-acetyltransferase [Acidobacteriota bacterium]
MDTEPTIESNYVSDEPLKLASGENLPQIVQHYAVYGELNDDKSNAVLVFHALSGSARIADWWSGIIGEGKSLDTSKNAFICINYIGSCYGSTGAVSINPKTGEIFGAEFPLVTVSDILKAQKKVLEHLGIEKLKAVIGSSVGGMCALQFAVDFPDSVEKCLVIGTSELSAMGLALNHLQREVLKLENDVGLARQIAMISYKSPELFNRRFGRNPNRNGENPHLGFEHRFDIAGYLDYQGEVFKIRFDAETFKIISKAMDLFELSDSEIQAIKANIYLVGISSDWLFPAADVKKFAERLNEKGVNAEYINFESPDGHDAFLSDTNKMSEIIKRIQI